MGSKINFFPISGSIEFESRFSSEEASIHCLYQLRGPLVFICPRCRATEAWPTKRNLLVCGVCSHHRPGRGRLSGRIEVDETYRGGEKPGKRGGAALGKSLVVIAAEKDGKRIGRRKGGRRMRRRVWGQTPEKGSLNYSSEIDYTYNAS